MNDKEMQTLVVLIGNSDDKLTQKQWAGFVLELTDCIERRAAHVHFWGGSATGGRSRS